MKPGRVSLITSAVVLWLAGSAASAADTDRPRVLIDRSHEWLFAYDDLSERMLQPAGFDVVLCDASLDTKMHLADFDIVMVQQAHCPFRFSKAETTTLLKYVKNGGRLLLVANPNCPIAEVVSRFGVQLRPGQGQVPARSTPLLQQHGADQELQPQPINCLVAVRGKCENLITDASGQPIAVLLAYGKGKVTVFADDLSYWDFCAQRDAAMHVPNTATTLAIFKCLLPSSPPAGDGRPVERVSAERMTHLKTITVRYSNPIADHAKALLKLLPRIEDFVATANGGIPPADRLVVHMLAGDGGGWSGGPEIGVQCSGELGGNIAVIAHEMTHSWEGILPGILSEGWASLVGMRTARALGFPGVAAAERTYWQDQYAKAERNGHKLDLATEDVDHPPWAHYEGKMMRLIEDLEHRYGPDFMPRFLELKWAIKNGDSVSIQEVLGLFQLAAGKDLTTFYDAYGITAPAVTSFSEPEVATRLDTYRQKEQAWREDQRVLEEFTHAHRRIDDRRWRDLWSVHDNVYPPPSWIDDGEAPPAALAHLNVPPGPNRAGFLVMHAAAKDKPCRLERQVVLPDRPAELHLGAARQGSRSVLRLFVNDEEVWSRILDRNGWFHATIDLARFAGQSVTLSLRSDTEGQWGNREVFIDYALLSSDLAARRSARNETRE